MKSTMDSTDSTVKITLIIMGEIVKTMKGNRKGNKRKKGRGIIIRGV